MMKRLNVFLLSAILFTGMMAVPSAWAQQVKFDVPVVDAADKGNKIMVMEFIKRHADVNERDKFDTTALMRAAYRGHVDVVNLLLRAGADPEARDIGKATALHVASREGHVDVVKALLKGGADIEARDSEGWTPLMRAAINNREDVLAVLLKHDANPDATNLLGETALMHAVQRRNEKAVKLLLDKGANPNHVDATGTSVMELARRKRMAEPKKERQDPVQTPAPVQAMASAQRPNVMPDRGFSPEALLPRSELAALTPAPEGRRRPRDNAAIVRNRVEQLRSDAMLQHYTASSAGAEEGVKLPDEWKDFIVTKKDKWFADEVLVKEIEKEAERIAQEEIKKAQLAAAREAAKKIQEAKVQAARDAAEKIRQVRVMVAQKEARDHVMAAQQKAEKEARTVTRKAARTIGDGQEPDVVTEMDEATKKALMMPERPPLPALPPETNTQIVRSARFVPAKKSPESARPPVTIAAKEVIVRNPDQVKERVEDIISTLDSAQKQNGEATAVTATDEGLKQTPAQEKILMKEIAGGRVGATREEVVKSAALERERLQKEAKENAEKTLAAAKNQAARIVAQAEEEAKAREAAAQAMLKDAQSRVEDYNSKISEAILSGSDRAQVEHIKETIIRGAQKEADEKLAEAQKTGDKIEAAAQTTLQEAQAKAEQTVKKAEEEAIATLTYAGKQADALLREAALQKEASIETWAANAKGAMDKAEDTISSAGKKANDIIAAAEKSRSDIEDEAGKMLELARREAEVIIAQAKEEAAKKVAEAEASVNGIVTSANVRAEEDANRILENTEKEAEAKITAAELQSQTILQNARRQAEEEAAKIVESAKTKSATMLADAQTKVAAKIAQLEEIKRRAVSRLEEVTNDVFTTEPKVAEPKVEVAQAVVVTEAQRLPPDPSTPSVPSASSRSTVSSEAPTSEDLPQDRAEGGWDAIWLEVGPFGSETAAASYFSTVRKQHALYGVEFKTVYSGQDEERPVMLRVGPLNIRQCDLFITKTIHCTEAGPLSSEAVNGKPAGTASPDSVETVKKAPEKVMEKTREKVDTGRPSDKTLPPLPGNDNASGNTTEKKGWLGVFSR